MRQKHSTFWGFRCFLTSVPPRDIRKNHRSMYARVPQEMAQLVPKNRKIVPYHGDSPNSRISARLRSPSLIMDPVISKPTRAVFK